MSLVPLIWLTFITLISRATNTCVHSELYKLNVLQESFLIVQYFWEFPVPCLRITGSLHSTPLTVHWAPRLGCMVTVPYDVLKKQCSSFTAGPRKTERHQKHIQ